MSTNEEMMMQFVELTGSDPTTAMYFLELSNFNLQNALELKFSGEIVSNPTNDQNTKDDTDLSAYTNMDNESFHNDKEDSIRIADPVKRQVLLDYSPPMTSSQRLNIQSNIILSRAEDPSVEWMFPPPSHISYPGTLAEARSEAQKGNKWILVNIQCDKEFTSHMLNRDVWTNETLVSLIRTNFIFWQRGITSQDGEMFAAMHRLSPELGGPGFPIIGIVDSRTGALLVNIKVSSKTDANDVTLQLMEFLETNSLSDLQAPNVRDRSHRVPSPKSNNAETYEYEDSDEDDEEDIVNLAAAMKASLEVTKCQHEPTTLSKNTEAIISKEANNNIKDETDNMPSHAKSPVRLLYDDVSIAETVEPVDGVGAVKISLKLVPELLEAMSKASGKPMKSFVRTFHGDDHTVHHVFATVYHLIQAHSSNLSPECLERDFDLLTAFPRASLKDKRDDSVNAAGLKGAQVIMQWL